MNIDQGPNVGKQWASEAVAYVDEHSGTTVRQLTDSRAHDHHLYFTNPSWYDGGDRLLFASDRTGRPNLFSIELGAGTITQLTDLPESQDARTLSDHDTYHYDGFPFLFTSVNPTRPEAYFWYNDSLTAIDLEDFSLRVLWEKPSGFDGLITNVTADGKTVCSSIHEAVDWQSDVMNETWKARPESRVIGVPTDGGDATVYHTEDYWINHVNTSPTRPELLTFCHEGRWKHIDHRIWGLNRKTAETWKIRECPEETAHVGHEFWLDDGEDIGYHGVDEDGNYIFGVTRYNDEDRRETVVDQDIHHFHARTRDLAVGDGRDGSIYLYDFTDETTTGHELVGHDSTRHVQGLHVHPRLAPEGSNVLFTSNRQGYGNVYLAEIPDKFSA